MAADGRSACEAPDPFAKGRELHRSIPAERWCINREDLQHFVRRVRAALDAGEIPEDPLHPSPGHFDPRIGPSMYSVSEHFLKPMTRNAGGMSYALMRNPNGLPCDVFVTHAWAEGVFEFGSKVLRVWPPQRKHLWCCLLALPQNLDITALLDVPLLRTPFARALQQAKLVIVVPNCSVTIYSRLWCVFEAYLATQALKVMVIPSWPRKGDLFKALTRLVLLPTLLGWLLGTLLQILTFWNGLSPRAAHAIDFLTRLLFKVLMAKFVLGMALRRSCGMNQAACKAFSVLLTFSFSVLDVYWLMLFYRKTTNFHPWARCLLFLADLARFAVPIHETTRWLQDLEVKSQAGQLGEDFSGVHYAQCSSHEDEQRIRGYIRGREDEVDKAIRVLMSAGAYSQYLERADSLGMDISNRGHTNCFALAIGGFNAWIIALVICNAAYGMPRGFRCAFCRLHGHLPFSILAVVGVTVALPMLAWRRNWDRTSAICNCRVWFVCAMFAVSGAVLGLGVPHLVADAKPGHDTLGMFPLTDEFKLFFTMWPGICALVSLTPPLLGLSRLLGAAGFIRHCCKTFEQDTSMPGSLASSSASEADSSGSSSLDET